MIINQSLVDKIANNLNVNYNHPSMDCNYNCWTLLIGSYLKVDLITYQMPNSTWHEVKAYFENEDSVLGHYSLDLYKATFNDIVEFESEVRLALQKCSCILSENFAAVENALHSPNKSAC